MFQEIEPYYGWLHQYSHDTDERSPFHDVEHNLFAYDRAIYTFPAHPLWDSIGSENLLVKILYADYDSGYAILELLGEWNDLHENDFRLLYDNCLAVMATEGIERFILIAENVFNVWLDQDDYYDALAEELGAEGWLCLLRARPHVKQEFEQYGISRYFYWSQELDDIAWRKTKPQQLYQLVQQRLQLLLE